MQIKQGDHEVICGILPRDAEFQTVGAKETPLCKFSVKYDEAQNGAVKEAKWRNCIAWFDKANYCSLFKKGDTVFVCGKVESKEYTKRDGEKATSIENIVEFATKMPSGFTVVSNDYGGELPD